eukprot:9469908-Pyramimonas_sp.AAC.2
MLSFTKYSYLPPAGLVRGVVPLRVCYLCFTHPCPPQHTCAGRGQPLHPPSLKASYYFYSNPRVVSRYVKEITASAKLLSVVVGQRLSSSRLGRSSWSQRSSRGSPLGPGPKFRGEIPWCPVSVFRSYSRSREKNQLASWWSETANNQLGFNPYQLAGDSDFDCT